MTAKAQHEMDVFRSFVASARLPIDLTSVQSAAPPAPDIQCVTHDGVRCQFELAELLWEDPQGSIASLAHGLALSQRWSEEKAALLATGKVEEAEQIQTWGSFGTPPLASVVQVLKKKCAKHYETDGQALSLLLYYARANPLEPFDHLATTYHNAIHTMLARSQFTHVWLYHYCLSYTVDLAGVPSGTVIREPAQCSGSVGNGEGVLPVR